MKILFLDDMEARTNVFTDWCLEKGGGVFAGLMTVDTAKKAIKALVEEGPFDLIFLDHDLGEEHYKGAHDKGCGCEVMRHIKEKGPWTPRIIVHSYNSSAAQRMVEMLLDGYRELQDLDPEAAGMNPPDVSWHPFGPGLKGVP